MSFDWDEFLDYAEGQNNDTSLSAELYFRIGVSRAYYAAFHCAKNFANKSLHKNLTNVAGSHNEVWQSFIGIKGLEKVESNGTRLKGLRRDADYECHANITKGKLDDACKTARKIIQLTKS